LLGPDGHTSEDEWCIINVLADTHLEWENSLNSLQQPGMFGRPVPVFYRTSICLISAAAG
ncbi:MAG: hypothetical protein ABI618_08395, partial [Nitrospirota bacterium]